MGKPMAELDTNRNLTIPIAYQLPCHFTGRWTILESLAIT
jgi:hypothetical protein